MSSLISIGSLVISATFFVAGCAVVSSVTPTQLLEDGSRPAGVYYALPKGVVEARLDAVIKEGSDQQDFVIDIGDPVFLPDPRQRYFLRYRALPQYHDDIKITVNDKSFIKRIDANTTDKSGEILVNVAKALAAGGGPLEAAAAPAKTDSIPIARITFDPTDPAERASVVEELNARLSQHMRQGAEACHAIVRHTTYGKDAGSPTRADPLKPLDHRLKALNNALGKLTTKDEKGTLDIVNKRIKDFKLLKQELITLYAACQTNVALSLTDFCRRQKGSTEDTICKKLSSGRPSASGAAGQADPCKDIQKIKQSLEAVDLQLGQLAEQKTNLDGEVTKIKSETDAHAGQKMLCQSYAKKAPRVMIAVRSFGEFTAAAIETAGPKSMKDAGLASAGRAQVAVDCTIGICYRTKEPYRIDFGIAEAESGSSSGYELSGAVTKILELPNQAELVAFDIQRGFFINKVTTLDFTDEGFLDTAHVKKDSELFAVSKLPLEIMTAVAEGFALRTQIVSKQRDVLRAEVAKLKAQQSLERVRSSGPLEAGPVASPAGGMRTAGARSFVRPPAAANGGEQ